MGTLGILFMILSIMMKLGLTPFHHWVLKIYPRLSYNILFFFQIFGKLNAAFLILKFFSMTEGSLSLYNDLLLCVGFLSNIGGTLLALKQQNFKKWLVSSSIANFGLIFIICSLDHGIYSHILFYSITMIVLYYILASSKIHIFDRKEINLVNYCFNNEYVVSYKLLFERLHYIREIKYIRDIAFLTNRKKMLLGILMFSLMGFPPLPLFIILNILAMMYYLKIVIIACFPAGFIRPTKNN